MKKLKAILFAVAFLAVGSVLCEAQTPITPKVYGLTNTTTFTVAGGALTITTGAASNIFSTPFPVWRDRGFAINLAYYATNAATANVTNVLQTATPIKVNGVSVTNWATAVTSVTTLNGTTEVFACIQVPKTTVDNVTLCRLATIGNAHTASIFVDPTNTFATVIP